MVGGLGRPGTRGSPSLVLSAVTLSMSASGVGISSLRPGLSPGLVPLLGGLVLLLTLPICRPESGPMPAQPQQTAQELAPSLSTPHPKSLNA